MSEVLSCYCMSDGSRVDVVRYPAGLHLAPHAHDVTTFSMVLHGELRETSDATTVRAGVFDLVVKPRGTRHENLFLAAGATLIQVAPSDETLRAAADAGCRLGRWTWTSGAETTRALLALARRLFEDAPDSAVQGTVEDALAAIETLDAEGQAGPVPTCLRRVRDALDAAADAGQALPSIGELADDAGVHRVHLSREFRRWFGVPPTEYRTRARLREAARLVGGTDDPLSGAAFRSGYSDQAHMTREFGARLGFTPLEYRRLLAPSHPA